MAPPLPLPAKISTKRLRRTSILYSLQITKPPGRCPQNVKNHLQKQRTKEAKAGAGGRRGSFSRPSNDEEEDLDDADAMDSGEGPASGGNAGPAPPRGAPAIWLADSWAGPLVGAAGGGGLHGPLQRLNEVGSTRPGCWAPLPLHVPARLALCSCTPRICTQQPDGCCKAPALTAACRSCCPLQCDATGVAPSNLIDLAKRALALTVHQLALYRKVGTNPQMGCLVPASRTAAAGWQVKAGVALRSWAVHALPSCCLAQLAALPVAGSHAHR